MNEKEVECPYCKEEFEVDTDDGAHYKDGEEQEETCPNCDKIVLIYSSCSWWREARLADCLNGISEHKWSPWWRLWDGTNENAGKKLERRHCEVCDKQEQEWHDI